MISPPPCFAGSRSGFLPDPLLGQVSVRIFSCTKSSWSRIFFGISNFHPKKFGCTDFRPELFWIFQFSNRKKYGRRNFAPTFFTIFKFRGKKDPVVPTFKLKIFGWKEFRTERAESVRAGKFSDKLHASSEAPPKKGFSQCSRRSSGIFFVRKFVLRIILWREMFCTGKSLDAEPVLEKFFWKVHCYSAYVPAQEPGCVSANSLLIG